MDAQSQCGSGSSDQAGQNSRRPTRSRANILPVFAALRAETTGASGIALPFT